MTSLLLILLSEENKKSKITASPFRLYLENKAEVILR